MFDGHCGCTICADLRPFSSKRPIVAAAKPFLRNIRLRILGTESFGGQNPWKAFGKAPSPAPFRGLQIQRFLRAQEDTLSP